jgi:uncharacterized protein
LETLEFPRAGVLRASNYTIYVDLPDDPDHVLLVHGYSGAYDRVSAAVARYVRSLDVRPPKPLYGTWGDDGPIRDSATPASGTIELLQKRGYLTAATRAEERERFDRLVALKHKRSLARVPSYLFMPTYDCNLRCPYCFQDHMRSEERFQPLLRTMTPSMIDRILAALPRIEERHGIDASEDVSRRVTFFGGEPLLARSRPVVEYIMRGLRAIGKAGFGAISNATELDAYRDLLGPDGIAFLQITIDGPKEQHDARRIYADGAGSFDQIVANVDMALDLSVDIDIRLNVDRTNIEWLPDLAAFFESHGWTERKNFSAYAAPVHAANGKTERKTTMNSHELSQAVSALRKERPELNSIGRPDDAMRQNLRGIFARGSDPAPMTKTSYCGAHNGMYIFDAFGDIYACWERTGDKNIRIGWLEPDGRVEFVEDRSAEWRSRTVTSNETCAQCRYSMYCGGGCAVLAEGLHGTMFGNYCDAFARRFRQSVSEVFSDSGTIAEPSQRLLELRAL